jgi:hypothetical protein
LITAADMALRAPSATVAPPQLLPYAVPKRERMLRAVLFFTMLLSSIAMIEPSPHDVLMGVLLLTAAIAGVTFDRVALPLFVMLLVWNMGMLIALPNVTDNPKTITYAGISIYLSLAAVLFTCLFARDTMARMAIVRTTYFIAAAACVLAATAGYFHVTGFAYELFTRYDRADGFFKDPNVFGPYLIWPALILMARMLLDRFRLRDATLLGILLVGLLLSLSRGAWMHFAASAAIMMMLLFLTAREDRLRIRMIGMSALGAFLLAGLVVAMLSIPSVQSLFLQRANALNYYDVGEGGRFELQEIALQQLLNYPFGMGPLEFARVYGLQQHNVYLQAFMVYGWLGGIAYVLMVLTTLLIGLRNALIATPWQIYAIVAFAVFVGEAGEGMVIDTDHWRHYFLIVGMIWGLTAATRHYLRARVPGSPPAVAVVP